MKYRYITISRICHSMFDDGFEPYDGKEDLMTELKSATDNGQKYLKVLAFLSFYHGLVGSPGTHHKQQKKHLQ